MILEGHQVEPQLFAEQREPHRRGRREFTGVMKDPKRIGWP